MPNRTWGAFLLALLTLAAPAVAVAEPKSDAEIASIAAGESEAVGRRVKEKYIASNVTPNMTRTQREAVFAEAANLGRIARNTHQYLVTTKLKEQNKQEYAAALVKLGGLMVGRYVRVDVEVVATLNADGTKRTLGVYSHARNTITLPHHVLAGKLDAALMSATHEAVHAVNWHDYRAAAPKGATPAEVKKREADYFARLRDKDGVGRAEDELRTESRARSAVGYTLGALDAATKAESDAVFKLYQRNLVAHERDVMQDVVNGTPDFMYPRQQAQARATNKLKADDPAGNFERSLGGEPVFGGIILGNKRKSVAKCTGLKIVPKGNDWQLVFTVEVNGKAEEVVYDQFTLDDLWSAYHVVRPSPLMKKHFQVWDRECNLVHCEDEISGLRSGLHPALAYSPIGVGCIALEVASGEVFLKDPGKKFGKELKIALQWYDAPSQIRVADGKLRVVADDDPDGLLLRLRLIGTSDPALANRNELPKDLADEKKIHAALADILQARMRAGDGFITAEQLDVEFGKLTLRSALKAHTNLKVDQKAAADAVLAAAPDLVFVDRFARTLAVLNWAAEQLGDKFPAWPKDAVVAHFPVETRVSEARVAELCQLPLPAVETMDIPDRQREKGKEVWYALMNQGRQVGWAQGFVGPIKLGDGEVRTKRWLKTVVYARRLNADMVVVRENTVETDAAGLMLRTKTVIGTAAGPKIEFQLSAGGNTLSMAILKEGRDTGAIRPDGGWSKDGVVYDSSYLALSGRGAALKTGKSETIKSMNLEDLASAGDFVELTITRVEDTPPTFRYKSSAGETVVTWDADGFPTHIRQSVLDLELRPTTEAAARSPSAVRPFIASALTLTPVEPPLATVRGTVRLKVSTTPGAATFPAEGDPEWKVIERPDDTSVVVENVMPLTHTRTGFRPLAAEPDAAAKKWLAAGRLSDSDDKAVKAFARAACKEDEADTPAAKCAALRRAVNSHIQGDYAQAGVRKASAVLTNPAGDCKHHALLLTALLRAEGIPARMVYGLVVNAGDPSAVGHAWVEAHFGGRWHRLDSALYGFGADTVYLTQGVLDDTRDLDNKLLKALTQPAVKKIEVVSVAPPGKPAPPRAKAVLTDNQRALVGRLAFAVGRARLEAAMTTLAPDGGKPGDEWKGARELAGKLGVREADDLPGYEGHPFADALNAILGCADLSSGAERRSWEERFGPEAAAGYAVAADCVICLLLRNAKGMDHLLPDARKKLEADLKTARLPARVQKDVLKVVFDDAIANTSGQKALDLLSGHFDVKDLATLTADIGKLLDALATQPGGK